jgi:uncharacterized RDD family membrane protein YckC
MPSDIRPEDVTGGTIPNLNIASTAEPKYEPAGFWRRGGATIIDGLIIGMLKALVQIPLALLLVYLFYDASAAGKLSPAGALIDAVVNFIVYMVLVYYYYGYFYSKSGASPGKSLLGLKVVDAISGKYLDYWTSFKREVFGKLLSTIILCIGYMMAGFRKDKMALHDLLFNTRVVKTVTK